MRSLVSREFKKSLSKLPHEIQRAAKRSYGPWKADPTQRSLAFKKILPFEAFSVRIGLHYRAICIEVAPKVFLWEWIGSHSDYDKIVATLG